MGRQKSFPHYLAEFLVMHATVCNLRCLVGNHPDREDRQEFTQHPSTIKHELILQFTQ